MQFRKYEKIYRLTKEEVEGILIGTCNITEKLDGANLSVWLNDSNEIRVGSRNNDLTANGNAFNGAVEYVKNHSGIKNFFGYNPNARIYGEWLVRHTLQYNETAYKKFYLFDVYEEGIGFWDQDRVQAAGQAYSIETVPYLGTIINPTLQQLTAIIENNESAFGERMEGIVIRNPEFTNTFGDKVNAKLVTEGFMEDNGVTFGGNNKYSECYWEQYVSNKYIDVARVQKIMNKIQPEVNERLDMKHIPRIINTVYHDMITEEAWDIAQKAESINYNNLKRICGKKIKQVFIDILNNSISVADS